ncbi:hypothetical protein [Kozakia baliensis]|uniref:Uncharacterized protein n=1 Tax=Kozakia baliensis TaxID=153496 RepID=A0A1D8UZ12_9PROT|nr:hypothetical protein [Kozakia baliensis]AOX18861.1 hypothetical protein A0U89_15835 [Kozakia baliensis]
MSVTDKVKKLSEEDLHDLTAHVEKLLHKHGEDLHDRVSKEISKIKFDTELHENIIPTSCKVYGVVILAVVAAISYFVGRKTAE